MWGAVLVTRKKPVREIWPEQILSFPRFADDGCGDVASAGCARAACAAALAATHASAWEPEVLVAWQVRIVMRAVARAPLFAKAAKEGDLDSNANPYGDDDEYDPARDVHV